jgi:hypothetical protein
MKTNRILLVFLLLTACASSPQTDPSLLCGEWKGVVSDVEFLSLTSDSTGNYYSGFIGDRLMVNGTWTLTENRLSMVTDGGYTSEYSVEIRNDSLFFNNGQEIYARSTGEHPEPAKSFLENLIAQSEYPFGEIVPAKYPWFIPDSTGNAAPVEVDGWQASFPFVLEVDYSALNQAIIGITGFFRSEGFTTDSHNLTEIVEGLSMNHLAAIVYPGPTEDAEGNMAASTEIHVWVGWKE